MGDKIQLNSNQSMELVVYKDPILFYPNLCGIQTVCTSEHS